jgi:hypothetical protein
MPRRAKRKGKSRKALAEKMRSGRKPELETELEAK